MARVYGYDHRPAALQPPTAPVVSTAIVVPADAPVDRTGLAGVMCARGDGSGYIAGARRGTTVRCTNGVAPQVMGR